MGANMHISRHLYIQIQIQNSTEVTSRKQLEELEDFGEHHFYRDSRGTHPMGTGGRAVQITWVRIPRSSCHRGLNTHTCIDNRIYACLQPNQRSFVLVVLLLLVPCRVFFFFLALFRFRE